MLAVAAKGKSGILDWAYPETGVHRLRYLLQHLIHFYRRVELDDFAVHRWPQQ